MEQKFHDNVDKILPLDHILSKINLIHFITQHRISYNPHQCKM